MELSRGAPDSASLLDTLKQLYGPDPADSTPAPAPPEEPAGTTGEAPDESLLQQWLTQQSGVGEEGMAEEGEGEEQEEEVVEPAEDGGVEEGEAGVEGGVDDVMRGIQTTEQEQAARRQELGEWSL